MNQDSDMLKTALSLFLPEKTLQYFDIGSASIENDEVRLTLIEKKIPPVTNGTVPVFKGYKDIIVSDFPIRGKKSALMFRRRYWKVPGEEGMLSLDIPLVFPGTKLEQAFAHFLKDGSGDGTDLLGEYRPFVPTAGEGL